MRLRVIALLGTIVTVLTAAQWVSSSAPALATACPVQITSDFVSENWTNGNTYMDVNGVRAPLETRLDGTVCGGGPEVGFDAAWISLEAQGGASITQIGFIHQSIPGGQEYCRFWANDGGGVHDYGCNQQTNGIYVYFLITDVYDPVNRNHYYAIEDCGTNGYGSCTQKDMEQLAYTAPWGVIAAETDYGGTPCSLQIMGSSSSPQNFGTSANPVQWQKGLNAGWTTESLKDQGPTCTHYRGDYSDTVLATHDDRN